MMKILMLVNWKVKYCSSPPDDRQPPDYVVKGKKYWFFRYFRNDVKVDVVDVRSFPAWENFEKNHLRFYVWQTLKILRKLNQYDVVLSHGMQSGIVLCLWRRLFGKGKYKHIVFDIGAFNSAREEGRALKLMQYASKTLDGVIYHTSSQADYYRKCHPWLLDRAEFIPFGADAEFFAEMTPAEAGKDETGAEKDRQPYILCIGYNKRDWNTLLKAFGRVKTDVQLRLLGKEDIVCQDERVKAAGFVPVTELKKQIAGSLFGVLPLRAFNYSFGQMTLLQQMAMGKAVIAADVPSLRDYMKDGETVLCYPPEDADALADRLRTLLEQPDRRTEIGRRAAEEIRQRLNEKTMAAEIETFINKILEKK